MNLKRKGQQGNEIKNWLNQIIQGDCLEAMQGIPDKSVDLLLTDIPYAEVNRESNGLRCLTKGKADIQTFTLNDFLQECDRVCRGSFYIFCGSQQLSEIDTYFIQNGISRRCIVWEKTNPSPMNAKTIWLSGIELCVYGKRSGVTFNGFYKNTVIRYPSGSSKIHPTEKPIKMFEDLILTSSNPQDIVLDPCIGSGTTAIAALNTGRFFIGIEKDEGYCEIARRRVEQAQAQQSLFGG